MTARWRLTRNTVRIVNSTQCNQVLTYRQEKDQLTVKTRLRLKNEYKETVNPVLLYLNPGLRVNRICINGERVDFYSG